MVRIVDDRDVGQLAGGRALESFCFRSPKGIDRPLDRDVGVALHVALELVVHGDGIGVPGRVVVPPGQRDGFLPRPARAGRGRARRRPPGRAAPAVFKASRRVSFDRIVGVCIWLSSPLHAGARRRAPGRGLHLDPDRTRRSACLCSSGPVRSSGAPTARRASSRWIGSASPPSASSCRISNSTPRRPISAAGKSIVVSEGVKASACRGEVMATTDRSAGMRRPSSRAAWIIPPVASWWAVTSAVTSGDVRRSSSTTA